MSIVHHQTENFAAGMPTDLAFVSPRGRCCSPSSKRRAAKAGGATKPWKSYYAEQEGDDPFNWIKVHPLMAPEWMQGYPFDHAGIGETSLMLAMFPQAVDAAQIDQAKWYTQSAAGASAAFGREGRDRIVARLREILR